MFVLPHLALFLAAGLGPSDGPPARAAGAAAGPPARAASGQAAPRRTAPVQRTPPSQSVQPMSGDIASDLGQTEAMHRAVVRGPIEGWRLEPIRARYQALLDRAGDSATASTIRARLAAIAREEEIMRDALTFEAVLRRSRQRDGEVAAVRGQLARARPAERRAYAAEGLIQPSSRKVEGQKVLALIGSDGFAVAYLRVPPGLDTRPLFTRRVGVRGTVNYDEHLHARVIAVNDIEPLDQTR